MTFRLTHVLAAVLVAAAVVSGAQGPSAEMMLELARKQEVVDGDLKGAIKTYDAIISAHAGNRSVVARALVAKAQCHEKLGSADAQQLYQQVLRQFADQKEAADLARARLAQSPGAVSADAQGLVARRLWEATTLESGDVSPDGQWLSQVDWTTGNLVLRNIATGQRRVLTEKTSWEQSREFAEESAFSPEGKLIAYSWFNTDSFYELRVIAPEAKSRPRLSMGRRKRSIQAQPAFASHRMAAG